MGRFSLVYVLSYVLVGTAFLWLQSQLPPPDRGVLEFFDPFQPIGLAVVTAQAVRGVVLAAILSPFADDIRERDRGWILLAAVLLGLTVVGSIEPIPGSIEGVIYTETTATAHAAVLAATAVQAAGFAWAFLRWETARDAQHGRATHSVGEGAGR